LSKRRRKKTGKRIARARANYARLHWGEQSTETVEADAAIVADGMVLTSLGPLVAVEYEATKGGESAVWRHEFTEGSEPLLCVTEQEDLVIVGGKYRVTVRGIVGSASVMPRARVVVANPQEGPQHMKRRRKKAAPRKRRRAATTSTRSRRRAPARRKKSTKRRRRNPSAPFKALALGGLAGLAVAAADFGLRGVPSLTRTHVGLIEAGGMALVGGLVAMKSLPAGVGLFAAGVGVGGAHLASAMIESKATTGTSKQLGAVQANVGGRVRQLNAVQATVGRGANRRSVLFA
jgi:hypothetical protein